MSYLIKKVLIVSFVNTDNFGNRLQQYALQRIIEDMGYETNILATRPLSKNLIRRYGEHIKNIICFIFQRDYYERRKAIQKRRKGFIRAKDLFYRNLIVVPTKKFSEHDWSQYDCVIAGSDQIWCNRFKKKKELYYYYLEFIDESKRLSYAPSFGFSVFPEDQIDEHKKGITGMRFLSCREQQGCELIYRLTGRTAQKVLDPTLLLSVEEWSVVERKPSFDLPDRYVLVFFLGETPDNYKAEIDRTSRETQAPILNINDYHDTTRFAISPCEFLWIIHHADMVCTDSFHCVVFSVIFHRNLRVFKRIQKKYEDMFARIHELLDPLGLLENVFGIGDQSNTELTESGYDYLLRAKKESLAYLKQSLTMIE